MFPTFSIRFLVAYTVSISGESGNADWLEPALCGTVGAVSIAVTKIGHHRLNHSYLPGLLRGIISRKALQLCNVRGSTATHGDPFNSCWLAVWLKRVLFTTWCAWPRDVISHHFQRRIVALLHFLALTLSWRG